jgi:hypothetical protein
MVILLRRKVVSATGFSSGCNGYALAIFIEAFLITTFQVKN